jgi:hypothetical protein
MQQVESEAKLDPIGYEEAVSPDAKGAAIQEQKRWSNRSDRRGIIFSLLYQMIYVHLLLRSSLLWILSSSTNTYSNKIFIIIWSLL